MNCTLIHKPPWCSYVKSTKSAEHWNVRLDIILIVVKQNGLYTEKLTRVVRGHLSTIMSILLHLMHAASDSSVPPKALERVRALHLEANELLRHFWSCFPVSADSLRRLKRYVGAMSSTYERVQKLRARLHDLQASVLVPLTIPVIAALDHAFERHAAVIKTLSNNASSHDGKRPRRAL